MAGGEDDGSTPTVTIDRDEAITVSQYILAMITRLQAAKDAGGLSQDDMLFLLQRWIKVQMLFQRGGGASSLRVGVVKDMRKEALANDLSKNGILRDYKANPTDQQVYQSYDEVVKPQLRRKPSVVLYEALNNLMNFVYNDALFERQSAFNQAEGAMNVLYYNYRIKLSADKSAEQLFRQSVARLRHTIR
jgi:hypothetical protein